MKKVSSLLAAMLGLWLMWDYVPSQEGYGTLRDTIEYQVPGDAIWQELPGPYLVEDQTSYKVDISMLQSVYPSLIFRIRREVGESNACICSP